MVAWFNTVDYGYSTVVDPNVNQVMCVNLAMEGSENRSCKILNFKVYAPPGQPSGLRSELAILSQAFL